MSNKVNLKELQLLFDKGVIKAASITSVTGGWIVIYWGDEHEAYNLTTQRSELRTHKTIDAAHKLCFEIGFDSVEIVKRHNIL